MVSRRRQHTETSSQEYEIRGAWQFDLLLSVDGEMNGALPSPVAPGIPAFVQGVRLASIRRRPVAAGGSFGWSLAFEASCR